MCADKIGGLKRKREDENPKDSKECADASDDKRPLCKYGESCYQKNSFHLNKFRHPHREVVIEKLQSEKAESQEVNEQEKSESISSSPPVAISSGSQINLEEKDDTEPESKETATDDTPKEEELPPSPPNIKENILQKFLVEMPEDFYSFWEFCCSLNKENPEDALHASLGLKLVGPFELFNTNKQQETSRKLSHYLTKWRFYYDPPQFQSVLVGDLTKGFHIGYFRDNPKELPVFLASCTEVDGCTIHPMAENLFEVMRLLIEEKLKKCDPFAKTQLSSFKKQLEDWATKCNLSFQLSRPTFLKLRKKKVVAKTFYQCGIVVPVHPKTKVGYREIPETDGNIKKICKRIVESTTPSEADKNGDALQELVTYVQYANDEMDYGMGLELGLDLLAYGGEVFHPTILHLLSVAYELLEQPEFSVILKAHLNNRKRIVSTSLDVS